MVRALAEVCREHPWLNASYRADLGEIHLHRKVHVGIATDTERGLLVPVVRDVGSLGITEVAAEIARLAEAARAGRLAPADMAGGTITVTNTGSYGSEAGTPILNPPQGAILALGVIEPRALVVEGRVEPRPACTLSLTFDHRLLDGATAGRALGALVGLLEDPGRLRALPR
ncbi:Dihydrolipoyllysine-residue acetyltransferase component of pyruvate dehydrogenase complex [bacterium HR12]|nr:Dihydrolipoyllysine-residue acetyltransferase component of pyruvate dehydrogenase complex [bacterium HR12]